MVVQDEPHVDVVVFEEVLDGVRLHVDCRGGREPERAGRHERQGHGFGPGVERRRQGLGDARAKRLPFAGLPSVPHGSHRMDKDVGRKVESGGDHGLAGWAAAQGVACVLELLHARLACHGAPGAAVEAQLAVRRAHDRLRAHVGKVVPDNVEGHADSHPVLAFCRPSPPRAHRAHAPLSHTPAFAPNCTVLFEKVGGSVLYWRYSK